MAPPMREAAAAAAAEAAPFAAAPPKAGAPAVPAWSAGSSPTLAAVCRPEDEVQVDGFAGHPADLKAMVDPEDPAEGETAELEARPATLSARRFDIDDCGEASPSHATLEAVLARL